VFYVLLNAPFIAMVQLAVYAGAIMVLFLFVIMLLGAEQLPGIRSNRPQVILAVILGLIVLGVLGLTLLTQPAPAGEVATIDAGPVAIGMTLFERYVFPFEVTSVLLLVAMIGVLVFRSRTAQRRKDA
jgi:NADH-quinone oxidoreductase subunit J